jgi:hypothetical protein
MLVTTTRSLKFDILNSDRNNHPAKHIYAVHDVLTGSKATHAYVKPTECEEVGLVF